MCALTDEDAKLPYDEPEIQQVRRDTLAWWIPLLADSLVCLTTLAVDSMNYGGAITVATDPVHFQNDPFARIFPGTVVETELFCAVLAPAAPVGERYSGVAWPGGGFEAFAPMHYRLGIPLHPFVRSFSQIAPGCYTLGEAFRSAAAMHKQ